MKKTTKVITVGLITLIFIIVSLTFWIGVCLPADKQYNVIFRSKAVMLLDQASFEGMQTQLELLWTQMNITFTGSDLNEVYNTPWYWEQTYDNSLKAQEDYFRQLNRRFTEVISEKNSILSGNRTVIGGYSQWYQQTLESLRSEMSREGGITWVIRDAWYLKFESLAYWFVVIVIILWITVFGCSFVILFIIKDTVEYYCDKCGFSAIYNSDAYVSSNCPKCGEYGFKEV